MCLQAKLKEIPHLRCLSKISSLRVPLRHRSNIFILMQLLELMIREPRGPTRLAQAANLNYQKCDESLAVLLTNQLVERNVQEGHEIYSATLKGKNLLMRWDGIFEDLKLP